jgi:hypothetical protein
LCAECTSRYASGREEPQLLRAGAAVEPLPTEAEAGAYVAAQTWTRARPTFHGRPQAKHEYVLLWKSTDPFLQLRVLAMIRAIGEARRWGRKMHHYWTPPGSDYEHWAMNPRESILNRRRLDW